MSDSIIQEVEFLGSSFLTGVLILILYDILRIFRRVFIHSVGAVGVEDFIYWMLVTFFIFSMLFRENNGAVRWFSVVGIFLGMVLYNVTVSLFFVKYVSLVFIKIRKMIEKILQFILKPIKKRKKGLKRRMKTLKMVVTRNKPFRKGWKHGRKKEKKQKS